MTRDFDLLVEHLINEYLSSSGKRQESRYWKSTAQPSSVPRHVSPTSKGSSSQTTKAGNRQYVGNPLKDKGIRINKSIKSPDEIAILKGIGGHKEQEGVNPRKIGALINSKQNMEIKAVGPNGKMRIGKRLLRNHADHMTKRKFIERRHKLFGDAK